MSLPFLRWAGGKRWLAQRVAERIAPRLEEGSTYIEPFLGGGAMYFGLAPRRAILSDNNVELIETYKTLRTSSDLIAKELRALAVSEEEYYRIRDSAPRSRVKRAIRFIYLNRTCYGGVHRTNQAGVFNVPYGGGDRSAKAIVAEGGILDAAAQILRETHELTLLSADFEFSIARARAGDVVYADPCYRGSARTGYDRYGPKSYSFEDQQRLAKCLFCAYEKNALVLLSTQTIEGFEELVKAGLVLTLWRKPGLTQPAKNQSAKEFLLVLDPKHEVERWEPLSDFNVKLNGKHRSDPEPARLRSNGDIVRRAVCEAAKDPLTGNVGPSHRYAKNHTYVQRFIPLSKRAKRNGISIITQHRLDKIARLRPDLLKQIADGKLSVLTAFRICDPTKAVGGLGRLRVAWNLSTEKEREIFRAEINNGVSIFRKEQTAPSADPRDRDEGEGK